MFSEPSSTLTLNWRSHPRPREPHPNHNAICYPRAYSAMKILLLLLLFGYVSVLVDAHVNVPRQLPPPRRCSASNQCPATPGPYMGVTITTDSTYRNVETSTCPPYNNPEWTNPSRACISQTTFRIPLNTVYARVPIPMGEPYGRYNGVLYLQENPTPIFGAIGVLSTGVSVFGVGSPCGGSVPCPDSGAPTQYVDAVEAEGHTVDQCGGHASPMGEYHIHSGIGINPTSERQNCGGLPADQAGQHSQLLGWAFDGFGIYGRLSQGGILPTVLDECSGHTHEAMTYHYHLPDQFPWTIGCYKGCPLVSNNPRQLGITDTNTTYGCPTGLSTDPNPTIEPNPTNHGLISEYSG